MLITKIQSTNITPQKASYNISAQTFNTVKSSFLNSVQYDSFTRMCNKDSISFGSAVSVDDFVASRSMDTIKEYIESGGDVNAYSSSKRTALYIAANKDKVEVIKELAKCPNLDPNKRTLNEDDKFLDSFTPLGNAAYRGNTNAIKELLKIPNIDVNVISDSKGRTPVLIAYNEHNKEALNLLLEHPDTDVNAIPKDKSIMPLIFAVIYREDVDALAKILKRPDVDLSIGRDKWNTCSENVLDYTKHMLFGSPEKQKKMLKMLEEYEANRMLKIAKTQGNLTPDNNVFSPAQITQEFIELTKLADDGKVALEFLDTTPLVDFEADDKAAIKAVLKTGNPEFATKVFDYIFHKQAQQREIYDKQRAEFMQTLKDKSFDELLASNLVLNTVDCFKYLTVKPEFDPNIEVDGKTLFQKACEIDDSGELAKNLLGQYDNIDTSKVKTKKSPIADMIAEYNNTGRYSVMLNNFRFGLVNPQKADEVVKKMKEFVKSDEFNPETVDMAGNNIVHTAANSHSDGINEVIYLAVRKGADINAQNMFGQTPLMIALKNLQRFTDDEENKRHIFAMIKFMLDKGASVFAQDAQGKTPLHYACASKSPTALKLILSHDANVHTKDNNGNMAKYYLSTDEMKEVYKNYILSAI